MARARRTRPVSPGRRAELTPEVEQAVLAFLRAGGFPHVAAEAAGVPRAVFEAWMKRGEGKRPPARYRAFAAAVRQAVAQARLGAETAALADRPLDWLRHGPGRPGPDGPGWSAPARAPADPGGRGPPLLLRADVQALAAELLAALAPFPEARAAVADLLARRAEPPPA